MLTAKEIQGAQNSPGSMTLKILKVNGVGGLNVRTRKGMVAVMPGDVVTVEDSKSKGFLLRGEYAEPTGDSDFIAKPKKKKKSFSAA